MATLKTKQKDFKNISGGTDIGGAPIFANDFVRLNQNAKADFINEMEDLRRKLPTFLASVDGIAAPTNEFESGLILAGLEYDQTDPANPVVSPGYFLSGGEVCYYAGGVISAGVNPRLIYLYKGAATYDSRVFEDGFNKEILVDYPAVLEVGEYTGIGPVMPVGTGITATDEVIVISITGDKQVGETSFSKQSALKVPELGLQITKKLWTSATNFGAGWAVDTSRNSTMVSRTTKDGRTEIYGAMKKTFAGGSATESVCRLPDSNINLFSGVLPFLVAVYDAAATNWYTYTATITPVGDITMRPLPGGVWPTGDLTVYFDNILMGNINAVQYEYNDAFMDVTP